MNTGAAWPTLKEALPKVLEMQTKLHQWSRDDPHRRFSDLYNLVYDPAFLTVAWERVKGNRGARSAGVDGVKPLDINNAEQRFLIELRDSLKSRSFKPLLVKERLIPKSNGKLRALGIPTASDRVVQASLKLVLEPIFEANFAPCSYGFRPKRRADDAIAEIHLFTSKGYEWVLDADIEACFDRIDHSALMDRVRKRIKDKQILALVKSFLHAGVLKSDGSEQRTNTGTPQGGILSPLLANIALSVLDDYYVETWNNEMGDEDLRYRRKRKGLPNWRLVRYADDFVIMVTGSDAHANELRKQVAKTLAPMGLVLSEQKTRIVHIDKGFDFLGFRIQRQIKRGTNKAYIYSFPSKSALMRIKAKVRAICAQGTGMSLGDLLKQLNAATRGWATYFQHGCSKRTFNYLHAFVWQRVISWLFRKYPKANWGWIKRHCLNRWCPTDDEIELFNPASVKVTRYRYRGAKIPSPWVVAGNA